MAKKDVKEISVQIEEIAAETLFLLGIEGKITASQDNPPAAPKRSFGGRGEDEPMTVQIETDAAGILIGRHGETIDALQTFLNQAVFNKTGEWHRIVVNIGDYRERREESLRNLAEATAARAKETGVAQPIFDLKPNERRIIHTILSEDLAVTTESEGEGRDRHIVVKLKE